MKRVFGLIALGALLVALPVLHTLLAQNPTGNIPQSALTALGPAGKFLFLQTDSNANLELSTSQASSSQGGPTGYVPPFSMVGKAPDGTWRYLQTDTNGNLYTSSASVTHGQLSLATNSISNGVCQTVTPGSVNSVTVTNITTAASYGWNSSGSLKAVTGFVPGTSGGLSIVSYVTSGYINWDVCNWTSAPVTPGAVTVNWWVLTL